MNFAPDMLKKVLAGEKTQTRRPVKAGDQTTFRIGIQYLLYHNVPEKHWESLPVDAKDAPTRLPLLRVLRGGRTKWRVGNSYAAAPGRGKLAVCRYALLKIRYEPPVEISEDDARAEGFKNSGAFFDRLRSLYGPNTDLTAPYWALTFKLVEGSVQP